MAVGPTPSVLAAVAAAVAFDVMDARPYGALTMSRGADVTTALILLVTGLLIGAGAARLARYRRSQDNRSDALAVVMEASGLVATGEEQQLVTEALGTELCRALRLVACELDAAPPNGTRPSVARDGSLVGLLSPTGRDAPPAIDLPVWCQGEVVAHYRLTLGTRAAVPRGAARGPQPGRSGRRGHGQRPPRSATAAAATTATTTFRPPSAAAFAPRTGNAGCIPYRPGPWPGGPGDAEAAVCGPVTTFRRPQVSARSETLGVLGGPKVLSERAESWQSRRRVDNGAESRRASERRRRSVPQL